MKTTATGRVRVVVGVEVGSAWSDDCTAAQVRKQGAEDGENIVRNALSADKRVKLLGVESLEMTVVNEAER